MGVVTALAVGAAASLAGGAIAGGAAGKAARRARSEKQRAEAELRSIKNSRQQITNPYASTEDLSSLATDLSSQLTNNMANLSVATQAAEMEIEQADISLANTLDTLRATGSGAGGATALAQAALSSKKGVSASIEKQEAQNEKLRAQGEQQLQEQRMAEQQRLQGIQISEGQRVQGARAQGAAFVFGAKEDREMQKLDRVSAQLSGAEARQAQASADRTGALTGMIGGLASTFGSAVAGGAFKN